MVWIHGGGFQCGSGSSEMYGPDYFVEQDVVLVSINYRCGVLGEYNNIDVGDIPCMFDITVLEKSFIKVFDT